MRLIRPKIIGTLQIKEMRAGNLAVINEIKNPPNKIIIVCESYNNGMEIIKRLNDSKPGDILYF